jgi:hypothetical protein
VTTTRNRALHSFRARLSERGLARVEVLATAPDRELIRSLARGLAESNETADALRSAMNSALRAATSGRGGILAALRRSPLVGANLDLRRSRSSGRKIKL